MQDKVEIQAEDYLNRIDLDNYVRNELGDNIDANRQAGHTIEGNAETLKRLNLSTSNRIYGVKVVLLEDNQ